MTQDEDRDAFTAAMRDVKHKQYEERVASRNRPEPRARHTRAARTEILEESLHGSGESRNAMEQLGEELAFRRPGVSNRIFRELRRGRFSVEDETDLHGLSANEAKTVLREFIVESAERGRGCVRVIHGKGLRSGPAGPVLKERVRRWLAQWDEVLAFVSAQTRHGGGGAVYVLLRRR